jgi:glycosyltransferase involved in cell wall biosynthesis
VKKEKKVSIISPCYNGENYISRFLESVLSQTYKRIELIVVNDGSTDSTLGILNSYIGEFKKKKIEFIILNQENGGQAQALNNALKIFTGDYLIWIDSDDVLYPGHVQEKYAYLEEHQEFGIVSCWADSVYESAIDQIVDVEFRIKPKFGPDNFFGDLIDENNVMLNPGVYMVRREVLLACIPEREIFVSREGQNFQMILPIAYVTKCGYLEKPLYKIVRRESSHSREQRSVQQISDRIDGMEAIMESTIAKIVQMPEVEKKHWKKVVHNKYDFMRMQLACAQDRQAFKKEPYRCCTAKCVAYYHTLRYRIYFYQRKMIAKYRK